MRASIIATFCVLIFFGASVATHRRIDREIGQPSRELSKMMSVRTTAATALSAYFDQHDRYPGSLDELPTQFMKWGDEGSSAADLERWRYDSDGANFKMTWEGVGNVKLFLGGKIGQLYYSEIDKDRSDKFK